MCTPVHLCTVSASADILTAGTLLGGLPVRSVRMRRRGHLPWRALSVANLLVKPALFSAACKHSTRLEGTAARVRRGTERRGQRAETGEHNAGVGGWGEVGKASHNLARLGGGDVSRSREQSADRERGEEGRRIRGQTKFRLVLIPLSSLPPIPPSSPPLTASS